MLIFAGNRDKDLAGMVEVLEPRFQRIYLTNFRGNARCLPADEIVNFLSNAKRAHCVQCSASSEAWRQAGAQAALDDLICIAGSVFLAGELRPLITGNR